MDQYVGEIRMFAGTFAPVGFFWCDGSLKSIAEYQALFVLLGTTWGGDGQTTFAVPDLRSKLPVGQGTGPGLTTRILGQRAGTDSVTLVEGNLPQHNHSFNVQTSPATTSSLASGAAFASPTTNQASGVVADYVTPTTSPAPVAWTLAPQAVTAYGLNGAHENQMPSTSINYIIAYEGIFPSRP